MLRDQIFTDNERGITSYEKGTSVSKKTERKSYQTEKISLVDMDQWFDKKILPKRTVRWFDGNPFRSKANPNGVCSQAFWFVFKQYQEDFLSEETNDGYTMGQIVWNRFEDFNPVGLTNHTAAIMMKKDKMNLHKYEFSNNKLVVTNDSEYSEQELLHLHVYDLYYKKRVTLKEWLNLVKSIGTSYGTSNWIKIGTVIDINNNTK